jgi:hypothetical protein
MAASHRIAGTAPEPLETTVSATIAATPGLLIVLLKALVH